MWLGERVGEVVCCEGLLVGNFSVLGLGLGMSGGGVWDFGILGLAKLAMRRGSDQKAAVPANNIIH